MHGMKKEIPIMMPKNIVPRGVKKYFKHVKKFLIPLLTILLLFLYFYLFRQYYPMIIAYIDYENY